MAGRGKLKRGECRIIAGNWRGRKVQFDAATGLRPTTDRIRETVFNWLQNDIAGSHCLDAFAGSGAMGFEAASRGAAEVLMLEYNRRTVARLQSVIETFSAKNVRVECADTLAWIKNQSAQAVQPVFDIVFLDPPFGQSLLQQSCMQLQKSGLLHKNARIYIEHALNDKIDLPLQWQCLKTRQAGQVAYKLYCNMP